MGSSAAAGRHIESNSRLRATATRRPARRVRPRRALAPLVVALLAAGAGCGGNAAETDPLASIAADVRADERAPAPLAEVWRHTPESPLALSPAVGDDNVYFALDNRLSALAASDGIERWAAIELESAVSAAPVAIGRQVVVATHGNDATPPRLWWFANDSTPVSQAVLDAPIVELAAAPGTVVFVDDSGVGRRGGGAEWHNELAGAATVTLAVDHSLVLATTAGGTLHAFDLISGAQRWTYATDGRITRPRVGGDRIYVGAGMEGIIALRVRDGRVAWQRPLGTAVEGAPALAQDLVWVAALDSKLHALKASNGTELDTYLLDLSSRNYLDVAAFDPWVVVGASYGPWLAVRGPMSFERAQRPQQVTIRQPAVVGRADLSVNAASGPAGVAVVNYDGTVVFLQPQRAR